MKHHLIVTSTNYFSAKLASVVHKGQSAKELEDGIKKMIRDDPEAGDLIPGTGGLRKIRYATQGKGKSGGYRIIYYFYNESVPIYLFTIYSKSAADNISAQEKKAFGKLARELKDIFKK